MNLLFLGLTLGMVGKVLVAVGILRVHYVMAMEKSIDEIVIRSFRFEKFLTFLGITLIILGYIAEIHFYGGTDLLTCQFGACKQAASVILSQ